MAWHGVTDAQWEAIRVHLPKRKRSRKGGRPRADDRKCFEGLLWILWTGAPWSALPREYGAKSTVHRRLAQWAADGTLLNLWRAFLARLSERSRYGPPFLSLGFRAPSPVLTRLRSRARRLSSGPTSGSRRSPKNSSSSGVGSPRTSQ